MTDKTSIQERTNSREAFNDWLNTAPAAPFWNAVDAMYEAYLAGMAAQANGTPGADSLDAARYRHMRNNAVFRDRNGPGLYWYLPRFLRGSAPEQLDESIDAARASQGKDSSHE